MKYMPLTHTTENKQRMSEQIPVNAKALFFDNLETLKEWFEKGELTSSDLFSIPRECLSNFVKFDDDNRTISQLADGRRSQINVCHDFKGGYQLGQDLYPVGEYGDNLTVPYSLRFPELVDSFIYFSHHCVSVPPVGWSNYLHRYSIPVLGTLIFEQSWTSGELFTCDSKGSFVFVKLLTKLCEIFKFEGYMINFETCFKSESKLAMEFLKALTNSVELNVHHGRIIWYDSYIPSLNKVIYQNEVNTLNWEAYDNSTTFMTNYMWNVDKLTNSLENVGKIGMRSKVAIGIDIWGRTMQVCGDGRTSDVALQHIKYFGTNAMLFAPAWTYEKYGPSSFIENDDRFWSKLKKVQYDDSGSYQGRVSSWHVSEKPSGTKTRTFGTNFSTGSGSYFNLEGKRILESNWVQLSMATPLPNRNGKNDKLSIYSGDSYIGGSSLSITMSPMEQGQVKLFKFEQYLTAEDRKPNHFLRVHCSYKYLHKTFDVYLVLKCFIIRRTKSKEMIKIKDVSIKILLSATESSQWNTVEDIRQIPELNSLYQEEFFIESVQLMWTVDNGGFDSWLMVPENHDIDDPIILLGSIFLEMKTPTSKKPDIKAKKYEDHVRWEDNGDAFMWLILQAARLKFVSFVPMVEFVDLANTTVIQCNRNGENIKLAF